MSVFVHDDDTAVVAFNTSLNQLVILQGSRLANELFLLAAAHPYFEGKFVGNINTDGSYLTGIIQARRMPGSSEWQALVDVPMWKGEPA